LEIICTSLCITVEWFNKKIVACYIAIAAAIAAPPYLLGTAGFTTVGIAAGSLAATWMSYIVCMSECFIRN
jgi:hypothetical protein